MRSWSKLIGLFLIGKPPGNSSSAPVEAAGRICWPDAARHIAATMAAIAVAGALAFASLSDPGPADLWLGGDVNLGDGGRGQLQGISGIVQGATGIVNLEGPVTERPGLKAGSLRLWN